MIIELKNENYIKINKNTPVGFNRTYIDFTVVQIEVSNILPLQSLLC